MISTRVLPSIPPCRWLMLLFAVVSGAGAHVLLTMASLANAAVSASQERGRPLPRRALVVTGAMVGLWQRRSGGDSDHGASVEFFEDAR
eukprot:scaffold23001_cov46-Cyclotella_meneghiniana.AAC.3